MQAAGHFVQLRKTGADSLDPFAGVEKRIQAALIALDYLERGLEALFRARFAQPKQSLFRAREDRLRFVLRHQRAIHQLLRRNGDAAQRGFVADDLDITVEIRNVRQPVIERNQIAQAVDRLQFVVAKQFVRDGDPVDLLAALVQFAHARKNTAMLFERKVVVRYNSGNIDKARMVQQDRSEDESFSIDVGGKTLLKRDGS